jgi:membrane-bound lytic murein transglycosylase B
MHRATFVLRHHLRPLRHTARLLTAVLALALAPGLCAQPPKKPENTPKKAIQISPKRKPPAPKVAQKRPKKKKVDQTITYAKNPAALQAAKSIAKARQLDPAWVRKTLAQARFLPGVVRAVTPPALPGSRDWAAYRARVMTPQRIEAGAAFMRTHAATLARAEAQYGVPPSIVAGILGVETIYGRNMGQYRVLDALATLAFDFPDSHPKKVQRQAYFLSELEAFFAFCHSNGYDPLTLRGSYAGAMGMGQFMPSSWLQYAVDFDGSGHIDLFHSTADAIGSIAHYFSVFQWKRGMPTHYALAADALPADLGALLEPDILPSFTPKQLEDRGVVLSAAARNHVGLLALVALPMGESAAPHYVLGTDNFYAITRYNWSSQYAMAVIDLAQAIEAAAQSQP